MDPGKQSFTSDTDFHWFVYKLIQANLLTFFKDKQSEASEFVKTVAKLHSESMCAELVPSKKQSSTKSPPPPPPPVPRPVGGGGASSDAPTPHQLTQWTRPAEFYQFLYQLLLQNKAQFKAHMKQTETFIGVVTKLYGKALVKEFSAAPLQQGVPAKPKVIELAEENGVLLAEIGSLKSQLAAAMPQPPQQQKNGTLPRK